MTHTYDDDRPGCMRMHVASDRARRACDRFTRDHLRAFAKRHGLHVSHLLKEEIAWDMAQFGLIEPDGNLRHGFPTTPTPPTTAPREDMSDE